MANDGTGTGWDETHPSSTDPEGAGYLEIQDIRKGMRLRYAKEHNTPAASGAGGEHKAGSAKAYVGGSAPTTRPDGVTALDSTDAGRLWVNGALYEWTGSAWVAISGGGGGGGTTVQVALVEGVQTDGTNDGTFTSGAWQTRTLNFENDPSGIVTVSGNQFTLNAGTYVIRAEAPALQVDQHQARLWNVTDGTGVYGTTEYSNSSGAFVTNRSIVYAILTLAGTKVFQLQHRCQTTRAFYGFGQGNLASFGGVCVYSAVTITKLA
jgi:hypothetical protein